MTLYAMIFFMIRFFIGNSEINYQNFSNIKNAERLIEKLFCYCKEKEKKEERKFIK